MGICAALIIIGAGFTFKVFFPKKNDIDLESDDDDDNDDEFVIKTVTKKRSSFNSSLKSEDQSFESEDEKDLRSEPLVPKIGPQKDRRSQIHKSRNSNRRSEKSRTENRKAKRTDGKQSRLLGTRLSIF